MDLDTYRHVRDLTLESLHELESGLSGLKHEPDAEVVRALATLSFEAWRSRMPPDWEEHNCSHNLQPIWRRSWPSRSSYRALGALGTVLDGRSLRATICRWH